MSQELGPTQDESSTDAKEPVFSRRPFIYGAIGRWQEAELAHMREHAPAGMRRIHSGSNAALWSSHTVETWNTSSASGYLWWPLASGVKPHSWQEASERRLAGGLTIAGETAVLHTCALGLQELYTRRIADALYFCLRIEPLLSLNDSPVHVDLAAWAELLTASCPLGDATPFLEIRRLHAACAWEANRDQLRQLSFEPQWVSAPATTPPDPAEVVDLLQANLPSRGIFRRIGVPLSGGWDSRLLAALASRRSHRKVLAWTTDPDNGLQLDIDYATMAASALKMEHRVVVPERNAWLASRWPVRQRVQYQSIQHIWMLPLARQLHRRVEPLLDGLAGHVVKGTNYIDDSIRTEPVAAKRRDLFWHRLTRNRLTDSSLFQPGVAGWMADASKGAFERATGHLAGHPAELNLSMLITRTARSIALCPLWLLGPESEVHLPFVHPDVLRACLRPPEDKVAMRAFYQSLLEAAGAAEVAALPSTNDPRPPGTARTGRRRSSRAAIAAMARTVERSEVAMRLLSPQFRDMIQDPATHYRYLRGTEPRLVLTWAETFAGWLERYAARVVWPTGQPH